MLNTYRGRTKTGQKPDKNYEIAFFPILVARGISINKPIIITSKGVIAAIGSEEKY